MDEGTRVLVTGGAGLLGRHLVDSRPPGTEVFRTWRHTRPPSAPAVTDAQLDLRDAAAVTDLIARVRPDVVVHTAYDPHDLDDGIVRATALVASACASRGTPLVHVSTDVVFDGEHAPYEEDHPLCPVTAYGAAKAQAEAGVTACVPDAAIVRTSLLCEAAPPDPRSAWVVAALETGEPITLFTDEVRMPLRVDDLARRMWALMARPRRERAGVWHLVGPEPLTRHEIGLLIATSLGRDPAPLRAARSADLAHPRPRDLRLVVTRPEAPVAPNRPLDSLFRPPG